MATPQAVPRPSASRSNSSSRPTAKPSFTTSFEFYGFSPSSSPDQHQIPPRRPSASRSNSTTGNASKQTFEFYGFSPSSSLDNISNSLPRQRTRFANAPPMPSRSGSTDSTQSQTSPDQQHEHHQTPPQPQPHIPANAFNIMHEWEIESLEKWQSRLEQVRANQTVIRNKINALIREEKELWAKYDSVSGTGNSDSYHPSLRKRGPLATGEYAEWVAYLESEVTSLREELAVTTEAEERAEKGVRRATARLAEIKMLGGKWKTTSPSRSATPQPRSRSGSSSSATPSTSRSTSPGEQRRPHPPSRSNTTESNTSSHSQPRPMPRPSRSSQSTSSASSPPRSSSASPSAARGRPLKPSSQQTSLNPWLSYEDRWHQLLTSAATPSTSVAPLVLHFSTVPWPMINAPTCATDIRTEAIKAFIFSPNAVRLTNSEGTAKSRRSVLRAAILRWHPDKFLGRFLDLVDESEKESVKEGVEMVIRGLNEIMRMEAAKERAL
ncbi:hypothetical protein FRB94_013444 [Tulasnella sp. JGI-2019a]|nr:hypothetical protein FRB94_013444 [Tulasnella sp. JGI-2019a]KAG9032729.1 hypothetical protein FRB95_001065 [Tulasnella sp. JGI-2019a]